MFSTLLAIGLVYLHRAYSFKWYATVLAALGIFLAVFTIAWLASSIQEGEHQAGNVGLLVFGLPALFIWGITWRLITKKKVIGEESDQG